MLEPRHSSSSAIPVGTGQPLIELRAEPSPIGSPGVQPSPVGSSNGDRNRKLHSEPSAQPESIHSSGAWPVLRQ
jgi:hypothetical protein